MGSKDYENTLVSILGKKKEWIFPRIASEIAEIQKEYEEQEIPDDERENLVGQFLNSSGTESTFYSPFLIDRLRKLAERISKPPEGWKVISDIVMPGKEKGWIKTGISQIEETIRQEQDAAGIPIEERGELEGEFYHKNNLVRTFYSPTIVEALKSLVPQINTSENGYNVEEIPPANKENDRSNLALLSLHRGHTLDELKGTVGVATMIILDDYFTRNNLKPSDFFADIIGRYFEGEGLNRIYDSMRIDLSMPTFYKLIRSLGVEILYKPRRKFYK